MTILDGARFALGVLGTLALGVLLLVVAVGLLAAVLAAGIVVERRLEDRRARRDPEFAARLATKRHIESVLAKLKGRAR